MPKKDVSKRIQGPPKINIFDEYNGIFRQACVDYICRNLDDLKFFQAKDFEKEDLNEIVAEALDVGRCYVQLNAEEGHTQFVGFVKNLPRSQVCAELEESLGFSPFKQKGLLPDNLCRKKQYTLEEVANILSILDKNLGPQGYLNSRKLRAYIHTQQAVGEKKSSMEISLHPYMVAMTVTGKPALSKAKMLRFRYITLGAFHQGSDIGNIGNKGIGKLMESDIWKMWAKREADDEKRIVAVHKCIDDLFLVPCARAFCLSAEQLGKRHMKLHRKGYAARPEKSHYSTEGYQAYKHYVSVVDAYKRLLLPKEKIPEPGPGLEK